MIAVVDHEYETTRPYLHEFAAALEDGYSNVSQSEGPWQACETVDDGTLAGVCRTEQTTPIPFAPSNDRSVRAVWRPKTPKARPRTAAELPVRIVALYKTAWETHDPVLLRRLFCSDAVYREKSSDPPMVGLDEICAYWQHNAKTQRRVVFQPFRIRRRADIVTTSWQCRFFRHDLNRWLQLVGVFRARLRGDQICEFSERFQKRQLAP